MQRILTFLERHITSALLLRLGLATVFMYAAISSFIDPGEWVGYLPQFVRDTFNADVVLQLFSVYELLLAAWLLSGVYTRIAGLVCAATLIAITVPNLHLFAISFRDIGLVFAALALAAIKTNKS